MFENIVSGVFLAIVIGLLFWLVYMFNNAPDGYEDETGYHDGEKTR